MEVHRRLITFEGIDFTGKTTQANLLIRRLRREGYSVELFSDPGGTSISERIRGLLLDGENDLSPETELLLYSASRAQLVREKILPALKEEKIVICDRFYDSTTAYQGYGRGLNLGLIERINRFVCQGIVPGVTFLLDLDPQEAMKRRSGFKDRMEGQDLDFHRRVREGYLKIARREPGRVVVLQGERSVEELKEIVWKIVCQKLNIERRSS